MKMPIPQFLGLNQTLECDVSIREDEIDEKNEQLQQEIRNKLNGTCTVTPIMTIGFHIK